MHPPPLPPSHTPQDWPDCHLEAHCSGRERVTVAGPPHAPPEPWARASARAGETVPVPGMRGESSARLLVCRPHPDVSGRPEAILGDRASATQGVGYAQGRPLDGGTSRLSGGVCIAMVRGCSSSPTPMLLRSALSSMRRASCRLPSNCAGGSLGLPTTRRQERAPGLLPDGSRCQPRRFQ
jgi:hypothetical protein